MSMDEPAGKPESESGATSTKVRFRAILYGFVLCVPVAISVTGFHQSNIFSLMVAPVSALILAVLLNAVLLRVAPKWAFDRTDLTIVFVIVSVAASIGCEWSLVSHVAIDVHAVNRDINPASKDYFLKYLPDWLIVKDPKQVADIQGGGHGWQYVLGKMPLYFPKYVAWFGLFGSICFAMLCINSLMRGAWCRRERLTFPLIQLPVALTESGPGSMWRSKPMWIAFGIMFAIDMLNGFNYLFPNVPSIPVKMYVDVQNLFKDPPLSNMGSFPIAIYPFMAAIGLFMPSDMLLSFVVFFLLRSATHIVLASQGIPQATFSGTAIAPGPPYFDEQTWGGIFAMFLGALWVSKDYLKDVWRQIRSGEREPDGGITHRWAFIGLIVFFCGTVAYGMAGGMPVAYMVPYVASFLIFSIVLTRIRAQLGPPTHEFAFFGSSALMYRFVGNKWVGDGPATWMSQVFMLTNRIYRNHPMPYQLEAMKMTSDRKVNQKSVFAVIVAATTVGFFFAWFFLECTTYRTGNLGWNDGEIYLRSTLNDRHGPDVLGIAMTIFGFVMVVVLDSVRFRFPGFPLHPAGYVLSMNYGVDYYWFGLLIALFAKNFVQRYYGMRGYDRLRSIALGILLAEYGAETIWMTMAMITHHSTYTISFNDRSLGPQ